MTKLFLSIALTLALLSFASCLEEEEPEIDPCNDYEWARVDRDGTEMCFETADINLLAPNTSNAYVKVQFYNAILKGAPSIAADFTIPASGLELNTTYTAIDGDFFGTEEVIDGEIMFFSFDQKDTQGHTCITGTFSLITKNPNSGATTAFTNGKFVYFLPGKNLEDYNVCNPF